MGFLFCQAVPGENGTGAAPDWNLRSPGSALGNAWWVGQCETIWGQGEGGSDRGKLGLEVWGGWGNGEPLSVVCLFCWWVWFPFVRASCVNSHGVPVQIQQLSACFRVYSIFSSVRPFNFVCFLKIHLSIHLDELFQGNLQIIPHCTPKLFSMHLNH